MIAPVTADIALITIPAKPMIIPLFFDENQNNDSPVVGMPPPQF
jgi:hypothetical protein